MSGEVSESSVVDGLVVGAGGGGSTIRGMVINGFQEMIVLQGGGNTIEDDWLGTNVAGTAADPTPLGLPAGLTPVEEEEYPIAQVAVKVQSSGNQIGAPGAGNVISSSYTTQGAIQATGPVLIYGLYGAGEIYDTAGGNQIQGNQIGLAPGSNAPLIGTLRAEGGQAVYVQPALSLSGAADTVGGSAPGDENVIAGGGEISGTGSVLQGNTLTDGRLGALEEGLRVDGAVTVGGPTTTPGESDGNEFYGVHPDAVELAIYGSGAVVQGNVFRDDPFGGIADDGTDVTIGGPSDFGVGNLIEDNGESDVAEPAPLNVAAGINVAASKGDQSLIEHNDFEDNVGGGAVNIESGDGTTITDNVMRGNAQGIVFEGVYVPNGALPARQSPLFSSSGDPNDFVPYPKLESTSSDSAATTVDLQFEQSGSVTVDLYSSAVCGVGSLVQGEDFLGSQKLINAFGGSDRTITLKFDPTPAGQRAITATVTSSDGSTSEFSPCLLTNSSLPVRTLLGSGVTPFSTTVAITTLSTTTAAADTAAIARGRSTKKPSLGYGIVFLMCPPSTPRFCAGTFASKNPGVRATANTRFKIKPGLAVAVPITVSTTLLAKLKNGKRITVTAITVAHDGAKHPHHKTKVFGLQLVYR